MRNDPPCHPIPLLLLFLIGWGGGGGGQIPLSPRLFLTMVDVTFNWDAFGGMGWTETPLLFGLDEWGQNKLLPSCHFVVEN